MAEAQQAAADEHLPSAISDLLREAVADAIVPVAARLVKLDAGLHAIEIDAKGRQAVGDAAASPFWLGQLRAAGSERLDLLTADGAGDRWLPTEHAHVVARAPRSGGLLLATAFGAPGRAPEAPALTVRALQDARPEGGAVRPAVPVAPALPEPPPMPTMPPTQPVGSALREVPIEVTVHIERLGDRRFAGSSWAGNPGEQKRVEGFSLRPLQQLRPNEIEYKALHPGGVETAWVAGPGYCGTRGRSLPITGLAIRIAPHVQDQFSVMYQAAFFRSGVTEPRSNGAPCLPRIAGDALEGINIRIVQGRVG